MSRERASGELARLLDRCADLDARIEQLRRQRRHAAVAAIRELMCEHGFGLADLKPAWSAPRQAARPHPMKGRKVPIKYRDVHSGATWSGRGLMPTWLRAAIEFGRTLEDFAA